MGIFYIFIYLFFFPARLFYSMECVLLLYCLFSYNCTDVCYLQNLSSLKNMNLGWFDTYTADCALKNSACANCTRFDLLYMSVMN